MLRAKKRYDVFNLLDDPLVQIFAMSGNRRLDSRNDIRAVDALVVLDGGDIDDALFFQIDEVKGQGGRTQIKGKSKSLLLFSSP